MSRRVETREQAMQFLESAEFRDGRAQREVGYILPTVTEVTHRGEREWNIFSRLLKDRIVFIGTESTTSGQRGHRPVSCSWRARTREDQDIRSTINSPGGVVTSGLAMYDTMAVRALLPSPPCAIGQRPRWAPSCSAPATRGAASRCRTPAS